VINADVCRGQRKKERQIDLKLAIKEDPSMGGLYCISWAKKERKTDRP